jgi:predicted dehydrogenase
MKENNQKFETVIIGAGAVAGGYDNPESSEVVTHAHGYVAHPKTNLKGFFDVDFSRAIDAAKKWGTEAFDNFEKMMESVKPDIVSICSPDETHFEMLKKVLKYKPKIVISEKPLTLDLDETKDILKQYEDARISILVNYRRRFDETVQQIKEKLERGEFGKVLSASAIYGKGLLHSGSHMIDLSRYLFGEIESVQALFQRIDYKESDPTISGFLKFEKCPALHLIVGDEKSYSIFELDIFCEKGRIRFLNEGLSIEIQKIEKPDNPLQKGYSVLEPPVSTKTKIEKTALRMVENAIDHIVDAAPLLSDGRGAEKTQEACSMLINDK